jgi:hypothetical protein
MLISAYVKPMAIRADDRRGTCSGWATLVPTDTFGVSAAAQPELC